MPESVQLAYALAALCLIAVLVYYYVSRSRASRRFIARDRLTEQQFAALFERQSERAVAAGIRRRLGLHTPVYAELLRPDDLLREDLQLHVGRARAGSFADEVKKTVGELSSFAIRVKYVAGVKMSDHDAESMRTVRDIVAYVAARNSAPGT